MTTEKEEWTVTKGGFHKMEIDLEQDVIDGLVDVWARKNLQPASLEQYTEILEDTGNHREAVYEAVINDIIIESLVEQIARHEAEIDANTKDV